jgi:hypothetical protein
MNFISTTQSHYAVLMYRLLTYYEKNLPDSKRAHFDWIHARSDLYEALHPDLLELTRAANKRYVFRKAIFTHKYCTTCRTLHHTPSGTPNLFRYWCCNCIETNLPDGTLLSGENPNFQRHHLNPIVHHFCSEVRELQLEMEELLVLNNITALPLC